MGDGGDGAEVVDERLWSEEDKEGKEGMPEEKYEKGGAVQTRPDDDLEFRGADEAEKTPEQAEKPGDQQEQCDGKKRKEAAEEVAGDAPINTLEPDNVEEAHGIEPEGAACDDTDDVPGDVEPLELPQDLGLEGDDDGGDAADADADADQLGDGDGDTKSEDAGAAGPDFAEEAGDEMEHDSDGGAEHDEIMPSVPDDGDAGAAPDIDQGAAAGSKGFGGSNALNVAQPPDHTPAGELAAAQKDGGAIAVGSAGVAPGQLEETAFDEDNERVQVQDSAANAMTAGGGTGGGGGRGDATGGADGLTAPASQSAGGAARSNPNSVTEPNPYRNLGDALQSWRERLSVRPPLLVSFSAQTGLPSLHHAPGGCHISYHSNFSEQRCRPQYICTDGWR